MKIVFATDIYFPAVGGIQIVTKRLAQYLSQEGNEVYIIAPSVGMKETIKMDGKITVYGVPSLPIPFFQNLRFCISYLAKPKVFKFLNQINPDIIHIQTNSAIAESAGQFAKKFGVASIATGHFTEEEAVFAFRKVKILRNFIQVLVAKMYRSVWKNVDVLTSPAAYLAEYFYKKVRSDKQVFMVSNGVDLEKFRQRMTRKRTPTILFVGRLDPIKQVETIIKGMPLVLNQMRVKLVLVGGGSDEEKLKTLAKTLGIATSVRFEGLVSEKEIIKFHKEASLLVISSAIEVQPLAVLEAMAAGLPVIATNVGGLPELVLSGKNGYLFEPENLEELSQKMLKVLSDKKLAAKMGRESLKIAEKHDGDGVVLQFETLYQKAIAINSEKRVYAGQDSFNPSWKFAVKGLAIAVLLVILFRGLLASPAIAKAKSFRIGNQIKNSKIVKDIQNFDQKLWTHKQYPAQ